MSVAEIEILTSYIQENLWTVLLIMVWSIVWKGFALWYSARLSHKYWFIALLLINTLGILEAIYLFLVANRYKIESVEEKSSIDK